MKAQPRWMLACLLALLMVMPAAGFFMDPLPQRSTGVTAVAWTDSLLVAGHASGHVVATDPDSGRNVWSHRITHDPVLALASIQDDLYILQPGPVHTLRKVDAATGDEAWRTELPSSPTTLAVQDNLAFVGYEDGSLRAYAAHVGVMQWTRTGPDAVLALDVRDDSLLLTTQYDLVLRTPSTGDLVAASLDGGPIAAFTSDGILVGKERTLTEFDMDLQATGRSVTLPATVRAIDVGSTIIVGDGQGRLFTLDSELQASAGLATFANGVEDLDLRGGEVLAGFVSGWSGRIQLDGRPIALLFAPQAYEPVKDLFPLRFAYSDPDAEPGDRLSYDLALRVASDPPGPWQRVATGSLDSFTLSTLKSLPLDLGGFSSGVFLDARLRLSDPDGLMVEDRLITPFMLDRDAPVERGEHEPADHDVVTQSSFTIGIGHMDHHSGVDASRVQAWLDGEPVDRDASASVTRIHVSNIQDGTHTWRIHVPDRAGNVLSVDGVFRTDTKAPKVTGHEIDGVGPRFASISITVDEPSRCTLRTNPITQDLTSRELHLTHGFFLTGLNPDTLYETWVICTDSGGKQTTEALTSIKTPAEPPGTIPPSLDLVATPAAPEETGWYTQAVQLEADTDADATVWCSLDGRRYTQGVPEPPMGSHRIDCFAVDVDGAASDEVSWVYQADATAPELGNAEWLHTAHVLRWSRAEDPESSIVALEVQIQDGGTWDTLAPLAPGETQFWDAPTGQAALRLVAVNGAGMQNISQTFDVGTGNDVVHTTGSVVASPLGPGDHVDLRVRLAPGDVVRQGMLVDAQGIEHRFSDRITLSNHVVLITAPARTFEPGTYEARIELESPGATHFLDVGSVRILSAEEVAEQEQDGERDTARRESPAPGLALLVVGLAWLVVRRRD